MEQNIRNWFKKVKKSSGHDKLKDAEFLESLLSNPSIAEKVGFQNPVLAKQQKSYDELKSTITEFFSLLNNQKIYVLSQPNKSINEYSFRLIHLAMLLEDMKLIKNKILRTYLLANFYRSLFEISRHLIKDFLQQASEKLEPDLESNTGINPEEIKNYKRVFSEIRKNKFGISPHFFKLLNLIDFKYGKSFTRKFSPYFNIKLRNHVAHESCFYLENGLLYENEELITVDLIIKNIGDIFVFIYAYVFSGGGSAEYLLKEMTEQGTQSANFDEGKRFFGIK